MKIRPTDLVDCDRSLARTWGDEYVDLLPDHRMAILLDYAQADEWHRKNYRGNIYPGNLAKYAHCLDLAEYTLERD